MDVLSEVLKAVKLDGALFYNAEFSSPWCFRSPASRTAAPYLSADSRHLIIYHLLTEGRGYIRIESDEHGPSLELSSGDIVVLAHGDPHIMGNGPPIPPMDSLHELQRVMTQGLTVSRHGGGGEMTRVVCGYMACDPQLSRVFLAGLPPLWKINIRHDATGQWLEQSIRYSVDNAGAALPGGRAVMARLSEVLFIETLRRYIALLPPQQTGWLAGVRDPEVGKALALLHRMPARSWTIGELAQEVGASRSVLAERFQRYLSETPMAYLARWRLTLGAHKLTTTSNSVAAIAGDVGYESESAFNRAFKREFGLPPARFRSQSQSVGRIGNGRPSTMAVHR
jgi:AraC-like DNA-binding protein